MNENENPAAATNIVFDDDGSPRRVPPFESYEFELPSSGGRRNSDIHEQPLSWRGTRPVFPSDEDG